MTTLAEHQDAFSRESPRKARPSSMVVDRAWPAMPAAVVEHASQDPIDMIKPYWHALRRRLLWALGLAVAAVCLVAPVVWHCVPVTYSASHYLRLSPGTRAIVFHVDGSRPKDFGLYRSTQAQLIRSPYVLNAVARDPVVQELGIVRKLKAQGEDPVAWLRANLQVGFPAGVLGEVLPEAGLSQPVSGEIMQIGLGGSDPNEVTSLVQAVVRAYMKEVVYAERIETIQRLDDLDRLFAEKETEVRAERTKLQRLCSRLGRIESEIVSSSDADSVHEYAGLQQLQLQVRLEALRVRSDLAAQKSLVESLGATRPSSAAILFYDGNKEGARKVADRLAHARTVFEHEKDVTAPGASQDRLEGFRREVTLLEKQYAMYHRLFREASMLRRRAAAERDLSKLADSNEALRLQEEQIAAALARVREKAERIGNGSTDIERLQAGIGNLEAILTQIGVKREKLRIELNAPLPVSELIPARVPLGPTVDHRLSSAVLAGALAFGLPLLCLMGWDIRMGYVNDAEQVSKGLGLAVLGAIPVVPRGALARMDMRHGGEPQWHDRLTETVDGIMVRLLRKAEIHDIRSVLITSAVPREGKTTFSAQLAMSLARAGHRTVLVDFDVRRPAVNRIFGLPLEPGLSEVIRDECELREALTQVGADLWVLPAGRGDPSSTIALANGASEHVLGDLRAEFEFVILDSSPLLAVTDTRFVSQHVDMVVLSVRRDHSSAPKLCAACEVLAAFGAQHVEAVVIGPAISHEDYKCKKEGAACLRSGD